MRITITRDAGSMSVDGEVRPVDVNLLPQGVEVLTWDSERSIGHLQYDEDTTENVEERDFDEENRINAELRINNKPISEQPAYKTVKVRRSPRRIIDFGPFQAMYNQWLSYVPPLDDAGPLPELVERASVREAEKQAALDDTMGASNVTLRQLKESTRAEIRAWFDANVTTDAQLRRLVRWMFIFMIRRL